MVSILFSERNSGYSHNIIVFIMQVLCVFSGVRADFKISFPTQLRPMTGSEKWHPLRHKWSNRGTKNLTVASSDYRMLRNYHWNHPYLFELWSYFKKFNGTTSYLCSILGLNISVLWKIVSCEVINILTLKSQNLCSYTKRVPSNEGKWSDI